MNRKLSLKDRKVLAEIQKLEAETRLLSAQAWTEKLKWWKKLAIALFTLSVSFFGGLVGREPSASPPPACSSSEKPIIGAGIIKTDNPDDVRAFISSTLQNGLHSIKVGQNLQSVAYGMLDSLEQYKYTQPAGVDTYVIDSAIKEIEKITMNFS
jgi:hypothetical protein